MCLSTQAHKAERRAEALVFKTCHLEDTCSVTVTNRDTGGDPFPNCDKKLTVKYHCGGSDARILTSRTVAAAHGTRTVEMTC